MPLRDLIQRRMRGGLPAKREGEWPFLSFQREMNRLMDDFFSSDVAKLAEPWGRQVFSPSLDVKETDEEIKVSAELPGLDEKDIEVTLTGDALVLKGEKKEEKEEKEGNYYRVERRFGSFRRAVTLPEGIDADKAEAKFEKGVLTINIPKTGKEPESKKIPIKS
ncbi:MAG: Hsp20/alpha crystallin family protein [Syntrophales bacterium]|nr:Hsp20/alpha crystallin family protein [Syntrophales bacterium]MDD5231790.1 Hsp20/alpha crystallin family protein [Syntrophales bacterium]MDD5531229.1 Hsp20/alpha crystallin family protein [Syntrophales bacterium]HPL63886.1 Hsp20/alpha crystallin family protein [Syntrophales bacterium]